MATNVVSATPSLTSGSRDCRGVRPVMLCFVACRPCRLPPFVAAGSPWLARAVARRMYGGAGSVSVSLLWGARMYGADIKLDLFRTEESTMIGHGWCFRSVFMADCTRGPVLLSFFCVFVFLLSVLFFYWVYVFSLAVFLLQLEPICRRGAVGTPRWFVVALASRRARVCGFSVLGMGHCADCAVRVRVWT